jgi:RND family efflux transporter MFP subunit
MKPIKILSLNCFCIALAWSQSVNLVAVISKTLSRTVELPGEFQPFMSVSVHAKVRGYVDRVLVDRGSIVKKGQLLAQLTAPEMKAQIAEAQSKAQGAESERIEAEAQLSAAQSTADRTAKAAETPGAIAGNELIQAQKQVEAAKALVEAKRQASQAAQAMLRAQKDLESYLSITAPFDGVVTDRLVHPGALVGPGEDPALLIVQQISHLRLVVAVPEEDIGGIVNGAHVDFRVPAYPGRTYSGTVARTSHSLDTKTRTKPSLFVPKTSVVSTTERTFVVRDTNGKAEWVNVSKGVADGDLVEVRGDLQPGDKVVRRATDEIHEGTSLP